MVCWPFNNSTLSDKLKWLLQLWWWAPYVDKQSQDTFNFLNRKQPLQYIYIIKTHSKCSLDNNWYTLTPVCKAAGSRAHGILLSTFLNTYIHELLTDSRQRCMCCKSLVTHPVAVRKEKKKQSMRNTSLWDLIVSHANMQVYKTTWHDAKKYKKICTQFNIFEFHLMS